MYSRIYNIKTDCRAYFEFLQELECNFRKVSGLETANAIQKGYVESVAALRGACDNSTEILHVFRRHGAMCLEEAIGLKPFDEKNKCAPAFGFFPEGHTLDVDAIIQEYSDKTDADIRMFLSSYTLLFKSFRKYGYKVPESFEKPSCLEKRFKRKQYIQLDGIQSESLTNQLNSAASFVRRVKTVKNKLDSQQFDGNQYSAEKKAS